MEILGAGRFAISWEVTVPCGLVVRIRRFHRRGRGSIPRMGEIFFLRRGERHCKAAFKGVLFPKHFIGFA